MFNLSSKEKDEGKSDEISNLLKRCKIIGIDIPNMEYIPDLSEMIQIMNEGLVKTISIRKSKS